MRIDQATAPAKLIKSAVAYSLFIADGGVYAIKTGPGWRSNVRGRVRNELMVEQARATATALDANDLPGELAARAGSMFIPASDLMEVELSKRFDQLLTLHFTGDESSHRFQFDVERLAEVEAFVAGLARLAVTDASGRPGQSSRRHERSSMSSDPGGVETIALPSPCWGATPHVAVADGRLFIEHLAPIEANRGERLVVYRSTDDEQVRFVSGRLDLLILCQRLMRTAWGITPAATPIDPMAAPVRARVNAERSTLEHALAICAELLKRLQTEQGGEHGPGQGGSAEQIARWERILDLEADQTEIERKLAVATGHSG